MDLGAYIGADGFDIEAEQIKLDTEALHHDYIDEGAQDEALFGFEEADTLDWRKSSEDFKKSGRHARPDFSRFFASDWRSAKVAAKHLKFCPGENCKKWLPLHQYAANNNMPDRLDLYCIACNQSKRAERRSKIQNKKSAAIVPDKFELFNKAYKLQEPPRDTKKIRDDAIWREVKKRIERSALDARLRYKRHIPVDPTDIARRLFQGGRFVCNVTGQVLSPECFLEHHALCLEIKENDGGRKRLDIICSQCRLGAPPDNFKASH
jgi:hypothetical protein